jgi:methyl-accepting chemotaxis protein-1 (serine sensor receptor)
MDAKNWTIKTKLMMGFGSVLMLMLVVVGIAIGSLGNIETKFKNFVEGENARAVATANFRGAVLRRAVAARNVLLASQEGMQLEKQAVLQAHDDVQKNLKELTDMVQQAHEETAQGRSLVTEINRLEGLYSPVLLKIVDLALQGQKDTAIASMNSDCRPLLKALIKSASDYLQMTQQAGVARVAQTHAALEFQRNVLVAACVLAIAVGLCAGFLIIRSLMDALGAEPAALGAATQRVAEGDLSPVAGAAQAPAGSVLAYLGAMQVSLANIVGQVRNASDSIATGSAEIAAGNADLSQRTEQQASNLQETAASMEQLSGTVKNNSETANQADQLASSASTAAAKGGEVVDQVVATMQGIAAASKKISDIIGVIDGIAFQTNILALNAAVEAARAGEQGRGFAVVAGEVRTLAQRSANAAKEIKALIVDSVEKVEVGTRQVHDAGESMSVIVSQVKNVSGLIGEISRATVEQSNGIGQVSCAVNQLDQVTQQNAALVEQSAAAADSLRQQADRLTNLVAVFKVGAAEGGSGAYSHTAETAKMGVSKPKAVKLASAPVAKSTAPKPAVRNTAPGHHPGKPVAATATTVASAKDDDGDWDTF